MKFLQLLIITSLGVVLIGCAGNGRDSSPVTIPTVAIAKAKGGWASVYSKTHYADFAPETVAKFEPYTATLRDGEWVVRGTVSTEYHGAVLQAKVRASDGFTRVEAVNVADHQ